MRRTKEEQIMMGRVMSHLYAAPYRMTYREMANVWSICEAYVGQLIGRVRGYY